jgi:hypothetical protein
MPRANRLPGRSRLGLVLFAIGGCFLLGLMGIFNARLQTAPVFGPDWTPERADAYGKLVGSVDPLLVKYGYALRNPRFRYGLFGSSRGVGISHRHLVLQEAEFFNFSTGSTGFRQSVALIQALADAGKLPDTLLLTLDNHDIGYFRQIDWPTVFDAPAYHLSYLHEERGAGAGPMALVRAVAEAVTVSLHALITEFNIERLNGVRLFAQGVPVLSPNLYRADGSRNMERLGETQPPLITYTPPWPSMVAGMMTDIARLGRFAAAGTRVIIFETPIAPHLAAEVQARRSEPTARLRAGIEEACRQNGITCLPPPEPLDADRDLIWSSCCHAPPAVLGRYLAGKL